MLREYYHIFLIVMTLLAAVVFVTLYFVNAGYGIMRSAKWGPTINNRLGWVLMEAPVFVAMAILWWLSNRTWQPIPLCFFLLFELHYLHRAFLFPWMMRSNGRMPVVIVLPAILFNLLNAAMQGGWIFYIAPESYYTVWWFLTPQFVIGALIFFIGMYINIQSDLIVRNLRKEGDMGHYIPKGGAFRWVSSANYLGEWIEWVGFAILTWSIPGTVFAFWTFANLAPRAHAIHKKYSKLFGKEFTDLHLKRLIPFLY